MEGSLGALIGAASAIAASAAAWFKMRQHIRVKELEVENTISEKLFSRIQTLESRLETVEKESGIYQRELVGLEAKYSELKKDYIDLVISYNAAQNEIQEIQLKNVALEKQNVVLHSELKELYRSIGVRSHMPPPPKKPLSSITPSPHLKPPRLPSAGAPKKKV